MRRVVVTGMGIVSSIGNTTQEVLASLREAKSGIVRADKYAELGFRCQVHGAPNIDAAEVVDRRAMRWRVGRRPTSRSIAFTSCHGQPVRAVRGTGAGSRSGASATFVNTMVRDGVMDLPNATIVSFVTYSP